MMTTDRDCGDTPLRVATAAVGGTPVASDAARRPSDCSDELVAACGAVSEALEWIERARGHLYEFHQLTGRAHKLFAAAADQLRDADAVECARVLDLEVVSRDVIDGQWTFEIVEAYDAQYWEPIREVEASIRLELMNGHRHVFEAEFKHAMQVRRHCASRQTDDVDGTTE